MQHRLSEGQVGQLIQMYRDGASIDSLARRHEVHKTTVMAHLELAGIARRRVDRKMTDESVAEAAARLNRERRWRRSRAPSVCTNAPSRGSSEKPEYRFDPGAVGALDRHGVRRDSHPTGTSDWHSVGTVIQVIGGAR